MSNIYDINDKYIELKGKYERLQQEYLLIKREKEVLQQRLKEKIDYIDNICSELNRLSMPKTVSKPTTAQDFLVKEQEPLKDKSIPSRNLKEIVHGVRINVTPQ